MKNINAITATENNFEATDFITSEGVHNDRDSNNVVFLPGIEETLGTTASYNWEQATENNNPSGLVFDFCQVYDTEEAINRFCSENVTYSHNNDDNETTYSHNNNIEYPGTFVISPDKKLCAYKNGNDFQYMNAFDTVIFLAYKHLDTKSESDSPTVKNRTKSFLAFKAILDKDEKMQAYFKKMILIERGLDPETDAWMLDLRYNKSSGIEDSLFNYHLIIENDKTFEHICFSEFHQANVKTAPFEWSKPEELENSLYGAEISQIDYDNFKLILTNKYAIGKPKNDLLDTALRIKANKKPICPIQDWFDEIRDTWDYKPRIEFLLQKCFGVPDNAYYRFLSASIVIGAVSRALATGDGVQFDITPVLYGKQGAGKTSFCRDLFIPGHYTSLDSINGKDVELKLGAGICELNEAEVLGGKSSTSKVKAFLTETYAKHRYVYERVMTRLTRRCTFIITTNERDDLLRDSTGNRRLFPVICEKGYTPGSLTEQERNQLFAEALMYYDCESQGKYMYTNDPEILEYAESLRKEFEEHRELRLAIEDYIEDTTATEICAKEIYVEVLHRNMVDYELDVKTRKIILGILRRLAGWQEDNNRISYKKYGKNSVFRKAS